MILYGSSLFLKHIDNIIKRNKYPRKDFLRLIKDCVNEINDNPTTNQPTDTFSQTKCGFWKRRFGIPFDNRGKSFGLRFIYRVQEHINTIRFVVLYDKKFDDDIVYKVLKQIKASIKNNTIQWYLLEEYFGEELKEI